MSSPPPNPLKRPAPITHESSEDSIQVVSGIPPTSTTTATKTTPQPPTKKPKIVTPALVAGGAGSGGQTKLAFGPVGGSNKAKSKVVVGGGAGDKGSSKSTSSSTGSIIRGPTSSAGEFSLVPTFIPSSDLSHSHPLYPLLITSSNHLQLHHYPALCRPLNLFSPPNSPPPPHPLPPAQPYPLRPLHPHPNPPSNQTRLPRPPHGRSTWVVGYGGGEYGG